MMRLHASLLATSVALATALAVAPACARDSAGAGRAGVQLADSGHGEKGRNPDKSAGKHGDRQVDKDRAHDRPRRKAATADGIDDAVLDTVNDVLRDILGIEDDIAVTAYPRKGGGLPPGLAGRSRLPPGLARHVRETGQLPPGLQKRVLDDLDGRLPGRDVELRAGDLVILDEQSRAVVGVVEGILDIFRAASEPR